MEENFRNIYKAIQEADALLIGASNGFSISEGYNIFADDHWFQKDFGDFRSRYGIRNILQGLFFQYPTEESKWAFFSRLISRKCYLEQPGSVMEDLYRLVGSKDYFIVTSNGEDHFVPAGFDRDKVFEMEGRLTQSRCQNGCGTDPYETRMKFSKWRKLKKRTDPLRTGSLLFLLWRASYGQYGKQQCILSDRTVPKENARLSELY